MIEVTATAERKLSDYLTSNDISSPVRVCAMNSCSGSALGLALDEQKEGDNIARIGDITILVSRELSATCGRVTIDFIESSTNSGFSLTSERPLPGRGGCGGTCSTGGGCGC